jgi:hypothetical protein
MAVGVVLVVGAAVLVTGCSVNPTGRLDELRQIARSCPHHERVAALVALDVRRELRGAELMTARLNAVRRSARWVAACGGRLRVVAFSVSAVASVVIFDGALEPPGATENARLRRVDGLVKKMMASVEAALPVAIARVSSRGGDPVGQLEYAAEYAGELGSGFSLRALIESSGFTPTLSSGGLDRARAVRLAGATAVPDLSGVAELTFAGIGRVGAGPPPSTAIVAAERVFYLRVCERARAGRCRATSDLDPIGG